MELYDWLALEGSEQRAKEKAKSGQTRDVRFVFCPQV
jgi:hypothetical protein